MSNENGKSLKVRVLHSYYGCDTGCCGHVLEVGEEEESEFDFIHFDNIEEAKKWAMETLADEFPECADSVDWSTFEIIGGC